MPTNLTTGEFLRAVLPSTGTYFAAQLPKHQRGFWQEPCDTIRDLALAVRSYDGNQIDSYFAVQSYLTPNNRRRDNVALIRSLWTDIDVGKKDAYPDLKRAGLALNRFCKDAGIPIPTVLVKSGYGLHVYWTLTRDLTPEGWHPLAARLQALEHHYHLLADHSVTIDYVRVLRPVGTHNYKRDEPSEVSGSRLGPDLDPDELFAILDLRCSELSLDLTHHTPRRATPLSGDLADLVAGIDEYPPADAEKIALSCNVFRDMKDTLGANQDNPLWLSSLIVLAHTEQRDEVAQHWSSSHEDYDPSNIDEQLRRIDATGYKPPRCEYFRKLTTLCSTCTLNVNSPIALGMPERGHQEVVVHADGTVDKFPLPKFMEEEYRYTPKGGLEYREKVSPKKAKPADPAEDEDDAAQDAAAAPNWYRCSWQFPQPEFVWYDDVADEWHVRLQAYIRKGDWARSDIKLAAIGQGGSTLMRDLAGKLRVLSVGPPQPLERFMKTWIDELQKTTDTQRVVNHLGWQKDGSFLLGTTLYKPDGTTSSVAIGRKIAKYVEAHVAPPTASLDEYRRLTAELYDRPGYVPHQFALMSALGSVLLSLVWNGHVGIPVSLWSGDTGLGKTTLAKVGIAAWGDPKGSGQTAKAEGATELAMWTIAGQRRNLPVLFDEVTTWDGQRLRSFVYAYSDGTPKQQARAEGGLRDNDHLAWSNTIFLTANESVIGKISAANRNAAAQVARIFEYQLPKVGEGLDVTDQGLVDAVFKHYGVAGAKFLSAIITRQEQIANAVRKLVQHIHLVTGVGTEGRYWTHQVACAIVAGRMARVLGIFAFDPDPVYHWALDQVKALAGLAQDAQEDYEDSLADLIRDCYPGLIITLDEGRGGASKATYPPGVYPPRNAIHGRVVLEQSRLYLATGAVRAWCVKHAVDLKTFTNKLIDMQLLVRGTTKYVLGKGTNLTTGRASCYQFTGKAIADTVHDLVEEGLDNVVRGRFAKNPAQLPNEADLAVDAAT